MCCKPNDLTHDIATAVQPPQQPVDVLPLMFGDLPEKGLPPVRGQQLHDVREQGAVVELAERAVGDHARTIGVQPTQKDSGIGRCSRRQDDRQGLESV
jgi:hypothetical protein